jgi:ATP-dependent exoDNAse (exonuclease V) beta subunit|tara:strand:+ start:202 stop:873 length:672 start_codon:yes stop_codon:yes gene_type:complete
MKEFTCTLGDLESLQDNMTRGQENGKRFYQTPDGQKYPSVTTVTGLLTRDHIKLWRERVGEEEANKISSVAARRGTKMHSLFEQYLRAEEELVFENILDESMFKAVQPVLDDIIPVALEAGMYSDSLQMAGQVDCIGFWDNELCIIDFKTSAKYKEEYMADPWFHQMTAYAIMVEELTGEEIDSIVAVVAVDGGGVQVFEADPRDYVEKLYELRNRYGTLYGV